jgi:hypothetical protein
MAAFEPVIPNAGTVDRPARFWSEVSARFYRFLEQLPEHHDDIDVDVLKLVPVPV